MQQFDATEKRIMEALIAFENEATELRYKGNTQWTYKIKEKLGNLGCDEFRCTTCTSGFKDYFEIEWLFDLVWYLEDEERRLISIPLVVESEWLQDWKHIKYDFEKLLQSNAQHRLMICQAYSMTKEVLLDKFKSLIQTYQLNRKNDRYMFAILDREEHFHFELMMKE